ncbi:MAG: acyl-CoA thioesterase II [Polyangiales bacterium]
MADIRTLLNQLDLERLDADLFRGYTPDDGRPRIFGGLVAAQSLIAACRTVDGRSAHSLHAYFLREGDPKAPVIYDVDRIREGRSFATRRVVARQHGRAIFNLAVSFQAPEIGLDHQDPIPLAPPPESIPSNEERLERYRKLSSHPAFEFMMESDHPIDQHDVDHVDVLNPKPFTGVHRRWFRAAGKLPDDPVIHQGVLTYASDMGLLDTCVQYHGRTILSNDLMVASLDHAIWFHRPFAADQWLLYATHSPTSSGGRGLNIGYVFTQSGSLVATVVQEALMRSVDPDHATNGLPKFK